MDQVVSPESKPSRPLRPATHIMTATILGVAAVLLDVWRPFALSVSSLYVVPPLYLAWVRAGRFTWYFFAGLTVLVFLVPASTGRTPSQRIAGVAVALPLIYAVWDRQRLTDELRRVNGELNCRVAAQIESLQTTNRDLAREIAQRAQSETTLRQSDERFRLFMDNNPAAAWMKDEAGRYVWVSAAFERVAHVRSEDILGKTDLETMPESLAQRVRENDLAVLESGVAHEYHEKLQSPSGGQIRHGWVFKFPFHDAEGRRFVGGVGIDETERVDANATIQRMLDAIAPITGRDFFRTVTSQLYEACPVDYVFVAEVDRATCTQASTIAALHRGQWVDNFTYSLRNTPCEQVVAQSMCLYPTGVQREFPEDHMLVDMEIDSYLGIPLLSSSGKALGLIVLMHSRPIAPVDQAQAILQIAAARAGVELERKQSEEALRQSEARLRGLVDAIPDLIFRLDPHGRIVDAKEQLSPDLLMRPVEFLGKHHREVMPPHVSDQFDRAVLNSAQDKSPQTFEYELGLPDGRRQNYEARVVQIRCGDSVVVVRNITDRKQSEVALRASESRFRQLAENIREVFWIASADNGRVEYVSPAYEELIGRTCASLYADPLSWRESVHPDDRECVATGLSQQADDGYDREFRVVRPDGSVRWIRDRCFPIRNERGEVERIVGLAEDITERKQAEEELRDSQERLQLAVEAANLGPWDWNVRTNEVVFSREWKRQIGYDDHEILGRYEEWESRLHPDDRQRVLSALHSYLEGTASEYAVEFRLRHKDGTYRWIYTRGTALRDAEGRTVHLLGCHMDVTARKRAEALVSGQNRVLELVAAGAPLTKSLNELVRLVEDHTDGMHCSILLLDRRGMHLCHSVAPSLPTKYVVAIDGLTIGPSVGSCGTAAFRREPVFVQDIATDPLWRDYRDLALAHELRACWSMPIFDTQRQVLGTSAMYYHQPALPTPDEIALIEMATHTAGIAIGRHRMEETLRESENRLRSVLENLETVAVQAYELDGTITFWNKPSERLYGYAAAEVLGCDIVELLHGEATRENERRLMEQIAQTGIVPPADEVSVVTRDGHRRWVLASRVLHARTGRPPEFFCFDVDITDRKRAEEELAVRQAELLHASRLSTLGQMVSALSHEVAQPLSAVGNFAAASGRLLTTQSEDLLTTGPLDSLRSYIEAIAKQNERCGEILRRLRDFSRRGESRRTDCDVNLMLHESVDLIAHDLRRQDVAVEFQLAESLPAVVVDRVQLEQVLVNLLTNARDAVCTLPTERRVIQISSRAVEEGVVIAVEDHGVGFTDEVQAHLFEPFFTTKERGMGIGLNICQTIIREHGGRINAANNCWGGAAIEVWLPSDQSRREWTVQQISTS